MLKNKWNRILKRNNDFLYLNRILTTQSTTQPQSKAIYHIQAVVNLQLLKLTSIWPLDIFY